MSGYGFGSKKPPADKPAGTIDLGGLPSSLPPLKREDEARAVAVGENLGFVDRGQGVRRRKPAAVPSVNLYVKGPQDVIQWFIDYTDEQGHSAYWKSIEDFKRIMEGGGR